MERGRPFSDETNVEGEVQGRRGRGSYVGPKAESRKHNHSMNKSGA